MELKEKLGQIKEIISRLKENDEIVMTVNEKPKSPLKIDDKTIENIKKLKI
jgi:hypothetical protein